VLQVRLFTTNVSNSGFEALSKLHNLEQFIFGDENLTRRCDYDLESQFLLLCAKILPHLKVSGRYLDFFEPKHAYDVDFMDKLGYHNNLVQNLQQPIVLGLQLLNLSHDYQPNENITFSQLEELVLCNPSSRVISMCDRFTAVRALGFYCFYFAIDTEIVFPVLHIFGQRLHTLVLEGIKKFSLAKVLRLCPNLKRLRVGNCYANELPEQVPEAAFLCMEEMYLFDHLTLPPGFLKQVNGNICYLYKREVNN
jgi:hypothetical protein